MISRGSYLVFLLKFVIVSKTAETPPPKMKYKVPKPRQIRPTISVVMRNPTLSVEKVENGGERICPIPSKELYMPEEMLFT